MSLGSYTRLTGLKAEDLFMKKDMLDVSSDDEDDFDRDYKISKKDRRKEQIKKDRLTHYFKQMIYNMIESSY